MVLIDYSKRRADATPTGGNTVEIPRRHRGTTGSVGSHGEAKRTSSRSPVRTTPRVGTAVIKANNSGAGGGGNSIPNGSNHSHQSRSAVSAASGSRPRPSLGLERPKPNHKMNIRAHMERLQQNGEIPRGSNHSTLQQQGKRLSRKKSGGGSVGGDTCTRGSHPANRPSRKVIIPPIAAAPPAAAASAAASEEDGPSVGDWIDTTIADPRRVSVLSFGSLEPDDFLDVNNMSLSRNNSGGSINSYHQHGSSNNLSRKQSGASLGGGSKSSNFPFSSKKNHNTSRTNLAGDHGSNNNITRKQSGTTLGGSSKSNFPFAFKKNKNMNSNSAEDITVEDKFEAAAADAEATQQKKASAINLMAAVAGINYSPVAEGGVGSSRALQETEQQQMNDVSNNSRRRTSNSQRDSRSLSPRRISRKDRLSATSTNSSNSQRDLLLSVACGDGSAHSPKRTSRKERLSVTSSNSSQRDLNNASSSASPKRYSRSERLSAASANSGSENGSQSPKSISRKDRLVAAAAEAAAMTDMSASNNSLGGSSSSNINFSWGGSNGRRSMLGDDSGRRIRISRKERNSVSASTDPAAADAAITDDTNIKDTNLVPMQDSQTNSIRSAPKSSLRTNKTPARSKSQPTRFSIPEDAATEEDDIPNSKTTDDMPSLKDDSLGRSSKSSNNTDDLGHSSKSSNNNADEMPSLLPSKPLIQTSARNNPHRRAIRRPGGGGGPRNMDEAMPTAFNPATMKANRAKKPNPFRRCDTSDLVKEHRNRRPTVLVEMDLGDEEGLEMSESSEHSDTDFLNTDFDSKKGSNFQRSLTPPQEHHQQQQQTQAEHDWSKPSVQTVNWGTSSSTSISTTPEPGQNRRNSLIRSSSERIARSSTHPQPTASEQKKNNPPRRGDLRSSLSMSNVFVKKKPVLEKSISFTIRRRKNEGSSDKALDETNSTFAKLSESLGLDLNVNAPNHLLTLAQAAVAGDATVPANPRTSLEKMMSMSNLPTQFPRTLERGASLSRLAKPGLKKSTSVGGNPSAVAMVMKPQLKRSTSAGGASNNIVPSRLMRSTSAGVTGGGPTSIMGTKLKRNISGGMDGSGVSLSGFVGRRSVSPSASKGSLMEDRSGGSLSLSPTRKLSRATSAGVGFGVPDNKFGYEQRTEEARRDRGRSPGPRSTLKRATSMSDVPPLMASWQQDWVQQNHKPLGSPQQQRRLTSHSPSVRSRSTGSIGDHTAEARRQSSPQGRPSPNRIRRSSPNRSGSPIGQRSRSSSLRRAYRLAVMPDNASDLQFDSIPKPSRVLRRHVSHGDIDKHEMIGSDLNDSSLGSSAGRRRTKPRRSTSFSQAMIAFQGVKRRSSISLEPFKGVRRRPASLSPDLNGKKRGSSGSSSRSPDRRHGMLPKRTRSGDSLQRLISDLKNPTTPKSGGKQKIGHHQKNQTTPKTGNRKKLGRQTSTDSAPALMSRKTLDDSGLPDDSKSKACPPVLAVAVPSCLDPGYGNDKSGQAQDLALKRGYGKADPTTEDLGYEDDVQELASKRGYGKANPTAEDLGYGNDAEDLALERSYGKANPTVEDLGYGDDAQDLAVKRGYGKSKPSAANLGYGDDAQDLASKRGYGKANPRTEDLGYGDDIAKEMLVRPTKKTPRRRKSSSMNLLLTHASKMADLIPSDNLYGMSKATASAERRENRRQERRSSSMNHLKSFAFQARSSSMSHTFGFQSQVRSAHGKDGASKRGSNPTSQDLGYGETNNNDLGYSGESNDMYGKSRTAAHAGRRENRRQQGRSSSMNHLKVAYGYHGQSRSLEDDDSGDDRPRKGSMNQLLTSSTHHGRLEKDDDDSSVASSSQHSRRSRPRGARQRRMASMSHYSESKRNLMSDRREIDSSSFVTGSRIRRIDKGSQLGLAR